MKLRSFLFLMSMGVLVAHQAAYAEETLSTGQVKQVKEVVHDYLVTNPQVLVEASQALQKQEAAKAGVNAKVAIAQNAAAIFANAGSPVVGNPKGEVTLVEFFDYQCPHCKDMKGTLEKLITENPSLRVVYKELPIFGQSSKDASAIALAAAKQGADKYLVLHNALLVAENPLTKEKILQIAKSVGLDAAKLSQDMNDPAIQKQIDDNFILAQALNLIGTPTFVISKWQADAKNNDVKNAIFMPGVPTVEQLKEAIASAQKVQEIKK
jgi:protein-disulfide isomerase